MDSSIMTNDDFSLVDLCIPFLYRVGTVVVGLVSIAATLLYIKQDSLLYFPEIGGIPRRPAQNPRRYRSPVEHGIPYESHMIPCSDGVKIHSWLLLHPDAARDRNPTILFFHGNAGNIGLRLPNALHMYRDLLANVLMVEYRGYGDSDSAPPSEAGLKLDAEAALQFISTHPMIDTSRIFVFGQSLGGAVGFHLAQYAEERSIPLAGVIVENTFLSVSHMVDHLMPYLAYVKPLVLRIGWDSYRIVPHLKVPTLYLAGSADTLVPYSHMLELFKASSMSSKCARIYVIPGGTHNETWVQGGREYWERIRRFLAESYAISARGMTRSMSSMEDVSLGDFTNGDTVGLGSVDDATVIPNMPTNLVGMAIQSVVSGRKSDTTHKKEM